MSARKTAAKRDANERAIIDALISVGCNIQQISDAGVPDLLVWSPRLERFVLLEVKGDKGKLTEAQAAWWALWRNAGDKHVVRTVEDALTAAGY
jgi:hypothetical protein